MSHRCHTQLANPSPKISSLYQIPSAKIKEELQTLQHCLCFKLIDFQLLYKQFKAPLNKRGHLFLSHTRSSVPPLMSRNPNPGVQNQASGAQQIIWYIQCLLQQQQVHASGSSSLRLHTSNPSLFIPCFFKVFVTCNHNFNSEPLKNQSYLHVSKHPFKYLILLTILS